MRPTAILVFALGAWVGCHRDAVAADCGDDHCVCEGHDCICPASGDCDIACLTPEGEPLDEPRECGGNARACGAC